MLTLLSCALCYFFAVPAVAQKTGEILKFFHRDSPASMSIHEEATISTVGPTMAVFNNLVLFNQHEKQNRIEGADHEMGFSRPAHARAAREKLPCRSRLGPTRVCR